MTRIGFSLDDLIPKPLKDAASAIADLATSVPGASWVEGAFNSGAHFIGDIAKDPVGKTILIGISNAMLFPAVAGIAIPSASGMEFVGPQVASAVWALPSVAAGDTWVHAYVQEVTWRAERLLEFFIGQGLSETGAQQEVAKYTDGIAKVFQTPGIEQQYNDLRERIKGLPDEQARKVLKDSGLDADTIAQKLWVRRDSAASAIDGLLQRPVYNVLDDSVPLDNSPIKGDAPVGGVNLNLRLPGLGLPPGTFAVQARNERGVLFSLGAAVLVTAPFWGVLLWQHGYKPHLPRFLRRK